jgi:hypothetical protein
MTDKLLIEVTRTRAEGVLQVSLSQVDENGCGLGYRLAGPKHYNMGVTELLSEELTERDAANIRRMLDAVFPDGAA